MTIEDIRAYCIDRGLTDGTLHRILDEYDSLMFELREKEKVIEELHAKITNLETELRIQDKLREKSIEPYKRELELFQRAAKYRIMNVEDADPTDSFTLEETMQMYRNSIAGKMMEAIRKDCEE